MNEEVLETRGVTYIKLSPGSKNKGCGDVRAGSCLRPDSCPHDIASVLAGALGRALAQWFPVRPWLQAAGFKYQFYHS